MTDDERAGSDASADDVTQLLRASSDGSVDARDRLLALVYDELHAMARGRMHRERADHTLGATALVSEAYLRLFRDGEASAVNAAAFADRGTFLAAAANTMRRVLVDHARGRLAAKRGGGPEEDGGPGWGGRWRRVPLDAAEAVGVIEPARFLELDEAIETLSAIDSRAAEVVRLRFFANLEFTQIAGVLAVSDRTCKRDWAFARAFLHDALGIESEGVPGDGRGDSGGDP